MRWPGVIAKFLDDFCVGVVIGIAFGVFVVGWVSMAVTVSITDDIWQRRLIDRGLATHCPNTGEWAWKGECGEK